MKDIQSIINTGGNIIELPSGEFKGPVIIDKPCTVKGNSTTIWNNDNSVIEIRSQGVKLCNLRVEMISSDSEFCCIKSFCEDTVYENIEISGDVSGIRNEELEWIIPKNISLGNFKANTENRFFLEIYVPVETEIYSNISGLSVSPNNLSKGRNTVTVTTDSIDDNVCVYGEIVLKSGLSRRIYVSGKSMESAQQTDGGILFRAGEPSPDKNIPTDFRNIKIPENDIAPKTEAREDISEKTEIQRLKKGQRLFIDDIADDVISVEFNYRKMLSPLDIDPYVFLLNDDETVQQDSRFLFFSNPVSDNHEVVIQPSADGKVSAVDIDLRKVPEDVHKISVAYSIYQKTTSDNFSKLTDPFIAIRSNGNIKYFFTAEDLMLETTIIFFEIYRRNSSWKMNMIGAGYKNGLAKLCEEYGLKVGY